MMASELTQASRAAIATGLLALAVIAAGWLAGCERNSSQQADTSEQPAASDNSASKADADSNIEYADGPQPGPDTVLARVGEVEVTLADFERARARSVLVAPEGVTEVSAEQLAVPHLQINLVRNLLHTELILGEAKRRGLEATDEEKLAALESHKALGRYAPLLAGEDEDTDRLDKLGLGVDDLDAVAEELVLREKLQQALLDEVDDDTLWQAYSRQMDKVRLMLASTPNTPSMGEIDNFVDAHADRVEAHFQDNKSRYRTPRMVEMTRLAAAPNQSVEPDTLEQAAGRLEAGEDPKEIAEDLSLRLDAGALLVGGENPRAFGSEPGTTGYQSGGPRGAYAWKVTGFRESKGAELTPAVRREIAAELLRDDQVIPSKRKHLNRALRVLDNLPTKSDGTVADEAINKAKRTLDAAELDVVVTEIFARNERGFIPGVGLAEEVAKEAFERDLSDPTFDEPVLSRGKAWVVRLLDRQEPSRAQFDEDKERFRRAHRAHTQSRILDEWINEQRQAHDDEMDLQPLRVKYGVLKKQ